MPLRQERNRTHFSECVRLTLSIHELIASGKDETPEGDAIRDAMDYPWYQLSERERELIGGLSEDLYTIGENRIAVPNPRGDAAPLQTAMNRADWDSVLLFVRKNQQYLPPSEAAVLRAMAWEKLGQPAVASVFYRDATRIAPESADFRRALVLCSLLDENIDQAVDDAIPLLKADADVRSLLVASLALYKKAAAVDSGQLFRQVIDASDRAFLMIHDSQAEVDVKEMLFRARIYRSLSFIALRELEKARIECHDALRLEPDDVEARQLHAWLNRDVDPIAAEKEFLRATTSAINPMSFANWDVANSLSVMPTP